MGEAIGQSITYAVGVAISPLPIVAVIVMLLSRRAVANSVAFALGWVVGVAGVLTVTIVASGAIGTGPENAPSHGTSTVKLVLGVALIVMAARRWRRRPKEGEPVTRPRWLSVAESMTPLRAAGVALALAAVNPKNLILLIAGGLAIAAAPASTGGTAVGAAVFVLIAVSTVVVPVVLSWALGDRARHRLEAAQVWLEANNAAIMSVLLLVIGVDLLGKGLGGF